MSPFTEKLKLLRGKTTVEKLSKASGISITSIYKAEQTGRVKWDTIKQIYGPFLSSNEDRLETLVL